LPRKQWGERNFYEGRSRHPQSEYGHPPYDPYFQVRGANSRGIPHERGWRPPRQPNMDEEVESILREWEYQLHESRTEVLDYQHRVAETQQEIGDLTNSTNQMRSELSLIQGDLQQVKAENFDINAKFQELAVLERGNIARLREEENRCNGLEHELTLALKEKDTAVARVAELNFIKSSLKAKMNELETNAELASRIELEARAKAEKLVSEHLESYKQEEVVKRRELEGLHNRAVLALQDAKQDRKQLNIENERLKRELRSVKIQLSKQKGGLLSQKANQKLLDLSRSHGPQRYDGPLKGKNNLFWLKFRNPELKEKIEREESPPITPTSTPESSPDPR